MRNAIFRFFALSVTLTLLAFCLVLVVFISNEALRQQLAERRNQINQGLALSRIYERLVTSLEIVAARDNDEILRAMLAQHGVSFALNQPAAATDKPEPAAPERAPRKAEIETIAPASDTGRLNPLLLSQRPATWQRLPLRSDVKPERIHAHSGGAIDPATSILYFFGSDNHGEFWNNDVWSFDAVAMTWRQFYAPDPPDTYVYRNGAKTTTTGHPWSMHAFGMTAWDPVTASLVVGVHQMHYAIPVGVEIPQGAPEGWWSFDPALNHWTIVPGGPDLSLGAICAIPPLKRIIGFVAAGFREGTLFDPVTGSFTPFAAAGPYPDGYTLRCVYDAKRNRVMVVSWDQGSNIWAFDLAAKRWTNLQVQGRPPGNIYGSWDYDRSADAIIGLWPDNPEGGFGNDSRKSRTFVVNLEEKIYREIVTEPAAPYPGMFFRVFYDPRHEVILAEEGNTVWSFKPPAAPAR